MAYDERGLQSLGIVTQKTDKKKNEKIVTKPMFIYTTKDSLTTVETANYFVSKEQPCLLCNTALDGSLIIIKGASKTKFKKLMVDKDGVVTLGAIDTEAVGTATTTSLFDPSLLNLVGANTNNKVERANAIWLYSSPTAVSEVVKKEFFKAKSTNPMEKMAEFDKVRQINDGDLMVITGKETAGTLKTIIKVVEKKGTGEITLEDYDTTTSGSQPDAGVTWDVRKVQMLGSSIATLKSNANSIRAKANLIKTATVFLIHDNQTLAHMLHLNYWKNTSATKPEDTQDIAKLSYVRGNMKTGDVIIIKATDKTAIKKLKVDDTTNAITLETLD